jgi:hypothetical protein
MSRDQSEGRPLERYAVKAGSLQMRELAQVALAQGHTEYSLAKALKKEPANVRRYFESERPRSHTVVEIAQKLGLDPDYVRLIADQRLDKDACDVAGGMLNAEMIAAEHSFVPKTGRAVAEFLRRSSEQRKNDVLFNYAMARHRSDANTLQHVADWPPNLSLSLGAFANAARPDFDLRSYIREFVQSHEGAFLELYLWCMEHNSSHDEANQILDSARLTLRQRRIPCNQLDDYLHADLRYRADAFQAKGLAATRARAKR